MPTNRARTEFFAGLFLVVSIILVGISIWILGSERQIFAKQADFRVSFKDVKGLNEGAPVRLGGISIGRVAEIGFSKDMSDSKVYVTLSINERYLDRVREDSIAIIETQGLLGDKFVNLTAGTQAKQLLPGSMLQSRDAGDFGAVLSKAETVIQNTVEISESFKQLGHDLNREALQPASELIKDLSALAREVKEGQGFLHRMIYSKKDGEAIAEGLTAASKSIRSISEQIQKGDGLLNALISGPNGKESLDQLLTSFQEIGVASKAIGDAVREARTNKSMLHTLLYSDSGEDFDKMLDRFSAAADSLQQATDALSQGTGTLGALLYDAKVYDNLVDITGDAKRSVILRGVIRGALKKDATKEQKSGAPEAPLAP